MIHVKNLTCLFGHEIVGINILASPLEFYGLNIPTHAHGA
jgi:hypothetical protein